MLCQWLIGSRALGRRKLRDGEVGGALAQLRGCREVGQRTSPGGETWLTKGCCGTVRGNKEGGGGGRQRRGADWWWPVGEAACELDVSDRPRPAPKERWEEMNVR